MLQNPSVVYQLIYADPDPDSVHQLTFVPFRSDGTCLALPDGATIRLPTGVVAPGEHWLLDSSLRIPLEVAGFRPQRIHPFARDDGHVYAWTEGADGYTGDRPHATVELRAGTPEQLARYIGPVVTDAANSYRNQSEAGYYADNKRLLEPAYLRAATAEGGSGFGGSPQSWRERREPIVDGVHKDGTFCDLGCANGLLMESVQKWAAERGIALEPYGVDISARLVERARERLPQWNDHFWVGNAVDWTPPNGRRFTFVHALFDFWPAQRWASAIAHVRSLVEPGGRLLMSQYGAGVVAARILSDLGYTVLGTSASTAWISPD